MKSKNKQMDSMPDSFSSEQEAGEFWDEHSTADYEEYLEPVDMTIDIKSRQFEIEIDEDSFMALRRLAKKTKKPMKSLASSILKENLV